VATAKGKQKLNALFTQHLADNVTAVYFHNFLRRKNSGSESRGLS
jgi:hypothetical protein